MPSRALLAHRARLLVRACAELSPRAAVSEPLAAHRHRIICNPGTNAELLALLDDALYLHARVSRVVPREQRQLYHRDASYPLVHLDCALPEGGGYLCMGLNNNYDASYYWARSAGSAGRLPVQLRGLRTGEPNHKLVMTIGINGNLASAHWKASRGI